MCSTFGVAYALSDVGEEEEHQGADAADEVEDEEEFLAWLSSLKKEERKLRKKLRSITSLRHSLSVTGREADEVERLKLASEAGTLERLGAVMGETRPLAALRTVQAMVSGNMLDN